MNKSVQDITKEILTILTMYDYPETPFLIQGDQGTLLRDFEILESEVFFLQELIELWYINRKSETTSFIRDKSKSLNSLKIKYQIQGNLNKI